LADAETAAAKIVAQTVALNFDVSRVGCRMARPSGATIIQLSGNLARSNQPIGAHLLGRADQNYSRRQLFANAAIAASRVGS
jgi:hypothetical protein